MKRAWLLLRLAWRSVMRHARRSALTGAAMMLGLGLMVMSRSLAEGAHEDWIEAGVRLGSGHVTVQAQGYRESGKIADRLSQELVARVRETVGPAGPVGPRVLAVTARLEVDGLAGSATSAAPVRIVGVDPEDEARFSEIHERVEVGRYLEAGDRLHAYIGAALAERLDVGLGRRMVLTAQDAEGEIVGQLVRVVGVYRTGIVELDETLVHIPRTTAAEWLRTGLDATSIALLLPSSRTVDGVVTATRDHLPDARIDILSWSEAMPELQAAVTIDDYGDYVFHTVLLAIVALAIVNTILMSVLYRSREFAILRALGLTRSQTGAIVFGEGVILTALGGVAGIVVGLGATWLFFRNGLDFSFAWEDDFSMSGVLIDPVIYPVFRVVHVVRSTVYIAIIGTVSAFYPAWYATRIDVEASLKVDE